MESGLIEAALFDKSVHEETTGEHGWEGWHTQYPEPAGWVAR